MTSEYGNVEEAPESFNVCATFRKKSHARFYDMKGGVRSMDIDEARQLMLTVGGDREVKIWSLKDVL